MRNQIKRPSLMTLIFALFGAAIVVFLVAPIIKMIFTGSQQGLAEVLSSSDVRNAIALTMVCALLATVIGMVLGVPLAYLLARRTFFGKQFVEAVVDVPVVIPHPVVGIALLLVFGRNSFGGQLFNRLGVTIVGDIPGIVLAMLFVSVSLLINAGRDGFQRVDSRLEGVSRTLGYGSFRTFLRVSLPLSWRALLSGAIMMWARAISEFGSIVIVTYNPKVASVLIYDRFTSYGLSYALPVAVVLVLICMLGFALLRGINARGDQLKAL
ncbi:MAG TPA: ABC transporter permease [Blastocatellia bacterium]|nr:ABC transporter permease [Blastocatellia bacterium]